MKTFVLGDIHGGHRALTQCLQRSDFNFAGDRLIFLGDATDGWSESPRVLEELLRVKNLIYILGNHDVWFMNWLLAGWEPYIWLSQGGEATIESYSLPEWDERRQAHLDLLQRTVLCFVDDEERLFVHGGIDRRSRLDYQKKDYITRDRQTFYSTDGVRDYREVFIGHTPTTTIDRDFPLNFGSSDNVWRLDTGAGWDGRLTIMEVDSHKFWQSDKVNELYPAEEGRAQFHRNSRPARSWRHLLSRTHR